MAPESRNAKGYGYDLGPIISLNGTAAPTMVREKDATLEIGYLRVALGRTGGGDRRLDSENLAEGLGKTKLRSVMVDLTNSAEESHGTRIKPRTSPTK